MSYKKLCVFVLICVMVSVANATTVWNPAGNGVPPYPATANWNVAANWTNGLPDAIEKAVLNVPGAAECLVTDAQSTRYWVLGEVTDGGVLTIQNGGNLSQTEVHWGSVGYSSTAQTNIEAGGTMSYSEHLWMGMNPGGIGTMDINGGLVNVGGILGMGWAGGGATGGDGYININEGGLLALSNIHGVGTTSIQGNSVIDITGSGRLTLPGDFKAVLDQYIAAGKITGNGIVGGLAAVYDGQMTTAAVPEPASLSLLALGAIALLRKKK